MNNFKYYNKTVLILLLSTCSFALKAQQRLSTDSLLNFGWKFFIGDDADARKTTYNDKSWKTVNVPHDGSISGGFDTLSGSRQNGYRPRHIGWYRKTFIVPQHAAGQVATLDFEGVYRSAEVWVNGNYMGKHLNGYTSFAYDISKFVSPGKTVTVAVRYDNTYKLSSRWYTGEGIYRNVWLRVRPPVHIINDGTYIRTPNIEAKLATVSIETEVVNQSNKAVLATLKTVLYTPEGNKIGTAVSTVPLRVNEHYTFHQASKINDPVLWDVSNPKRYTAKSFLSIDSVVQQVYATPFGIRTVAFDPAQGFLLNGKKVFLYGVNIHHDLGPLGAAAFDKGYRRRLLGLKKMGVNAVRLAHNPFNHAVLDLCDELGILVFNESFDKWSSEYYGAGENFADHWQKDLEWFIHRDRNHPSVFIWSVGNEVAVKQEYKDTAFVAQFKKMKAVVNRLDPSRKVTSGLYPSRDEDAPAPMAFHMDVVSDNYMTRFYKRDHPKFPQLVFLASEMTTDNGGETFFNYDHSYAAGQFYWGGTDYIGESFKWPSKGWNGIIDWCDFWKPITYYIKSLYTPAPMVKIAVLDAKGNEARVWNDVYMNALKMTDGWNWVPGQKLALYTFTTGDEVELFINNKSVGVKKLADFPKRKIAWDVNYEPGTIRAVARTNGKEIAVDEIHTAGDADQIVLEVDSMPLLANGLDVAYIAVTVRDKNGILVPNADQNINFKVSGTAEIAGVANGDRSSDELFVASHRKAFEGKCLLVIRSTTTAGKIKITANSKGLKAATLEIKSVTPKLGE